MKSNPAIRREQKGSVAVEYMILTIFIGLTIAAGSAMFGRALNNQFSVTGKSIYSIQNQGDYTTRRAAF